MPEGGGGAGRRGGDHCWVPSLKLFPLLFIRSYFVVDALLTFLDKSKGLNPIFDSLCLVSLWSAMQRRGACLVYFLGSLTICDLTTDTHVADTDSLERISTFSMW